MAEDFAAEAEGGLKKKMGPLELWQWAAGVVGLFALYFAYRSYKGGSSSPAAAAATGGPSVSTVPPSDMATTGANTTLSGQLQDLQTTLGGIGAQIANVPAAIQANPTPGSSSSNALGGLANWQAFVNSPAAYSLATQNQQAFISAQYESVLGRAPDTAGLQFWEGQLGSAPTQAQVTAENQAFLGATGHEIAQRESTVTPT